jgi:two-component system sensor kinase FixL
LDGSGGPDAGIDGALSEERRGSVMRIAEETLPSSSERTAPESAASGSRFHVFGPQALAAASLLAIGYYAGVQVGLALTFAPNPVSTLWPPNAILLAGLLLTPPRTWWLMIAAVLPAHLIAELSLGVPLSMAACWFVSNVAEALLGAALLVRLLNGPPRFERVRDLLIFLAVAVLLAPIASSFLDAGFVALIGWSYSGDYWQVWRTRLFSNALATLTFVPLIVIWMQRGIRQLLEAKAVEYAEAAALLVGLCVVSATVFLQNHTPGESAVLMYAPLPFLVWAAVRRSISGVSLCVAVVAMFAVVGVQRGQGPFTASTAESAALGVQLFLVIAEFSLMLLAASLAELRDAKLVALQQTESLNLALSAAQMGTWDWDIAQDRLTSRVVRNATPEAAASSASRSMRSVLNRIHADDRERVRRAIDEALATGGGGELECRFMMGDGGWRWITSRGKVLLDARGKPQRVIGVYVDTTERRSQEMQTQAQREQLAHLSRVSTLGELSGALAHELNQPLTAILINAQAARRVLTGGTPDMRELGEILEDIVAEDERAGEVIRRLRSLFMRGAVKMQPVNANECIQEVLALEHSDLIRRNVTTDLNLDPAAPLVMADRVQLQQVLLNLIVNACDAMADRSPGERRLQITSAHGDDGGVDIEVSDSGPGVANVEAIFEPFYSTKPHGVGLGLSICRTIITSHRGRLWATNNVSGGATFHIYLPASLNESFDFDGSDVQGLSLP